MPDNRRAAATLDVISGARRGESFRLDADRISFGRDPGNDFAILETPVSRRHCIIEQSNGRFVLRDLNSRNHTFVNGVPVAERFLEAGDEIRVGATILRFLPDDDLADTEAGGATVRLGATQLGDSTIVLRKDQARYLNPSTPPPEDAGARAIRHLDALVKIGTALNSLKETAAIVQRVLAAALDVAPVDRAALLLWDDSPSELTTAVAIDQRTRHECPVQASRTVVERVAAEGVALLSNDVAEGDDFETAESLVLRRVRSLMAIPVEIGGRVLGALYLDSSDPSANFDEDLLQLLVAVGGIAGVALENARLVEGLKSENQRLEAEIAVHHDMVGQSPRMLEVYKFISRVAPSDSTVLVWGESGTGKELVARAIHKNSPRDGKPFVAINCAAIAETLLESELFGHEKGAFTGAVSQRKGKFEAAEGGTVFLDEIGELAPALQAKLLRVLQEREFERLGSNRPIKLNVRLIAATNRDLLQASKSGAFRQDLYYRLNVVSVRMPALRERREDIPPLASYFARKFAERSKRQLEGLSNAARNCVVNYDWPGNVRELENAIERAVVMGSTPVILPEDLPEALLERPSAQADEIPRFHEGVTEAKKTIILRAVEQAGGQYVEAARLLGLHPNYLHRLMKNLNLKGGDA